MLDSFVQKQKEKEKQQTKNKLNPKPLQNVNTWNNYNDVNLDVWTILRTCVAPGPFRRRSHQTLREQRLTERLLGLVY